MAVIEKDYMQATRLYRQVLSMTKFDPSNLQSTVELDEVQVDACQHLHALANLAEVLNNLSQEQKEELQQKEGRTLNDDRLLDQSNSLRELYVRRSEMELMIAQCKWKETLEKVEKQVEEVGSSNGESKKSKDKDDSINAWWIEALNMLRRQNREDTFVMQLKDFLLEKEQKGKNVSQQTPSITNRFNSIAVLQYVLLERMGELSKLRRVVLARLSELGDRTPTQADIEQSGNCRQCRQYLNKRGPTCDHCRAEVQLMDYTNLLFRYRVKAPNKAGDRKKKQEDSVDENELDVQFGSFREPSEAENVLTFLVRYIKQIARNDHDEEMQALFQHGKLHLKLFEAMKQELKLSREVFIKQKERLSALDELEMATVRIRLRYPGNIHTFHDPSNANTCMITPLIILAL